MSFIKEITNKEIHSGSPGYKECNKCLMDTSDGSISFKDKVCNYCRDYELMKSSSWDPSERGYEILEKKIKQIKEKNKSNKYDCILGLSGGLDSSYLALILKEFDLRVLAIHVDGGWNSELAVNNIQTIIEHCEFDLHTHVVDWEAMKNLQLAFFRSGISNLDIPQDHVFFAVLYSIAQKFNIKTFMSGGNFATESILPSYWQCDAMDSIFIKDIFNNFGEGSISGYKTISFFNLKILFRLKGFQQLRPLNYLPYGDEIALEKLEKIGWRNYSTKHGESIFTKFFQNYFLIKRYGYDKRRAHYSSRILSNDMTREQAKELISKELYSPLDLNQDKDYVSKKLDISQSELDSFLFLPKRNYDQFKNWSKYMTIGSKINKFLSR